MTHIATHPPSNDDGTSSASPVYRMFGYLTLVDPNDEHKKVDEASSFKILFFNNTGHTFKDGEPVACHIALFEVGDDSPLSNKKKDPPSDKKKYCALGYDLMSYKTHKEAEQDALGDQKFEALSAGELDTEVEKYKLKTKDAKKIMVMEQAARYRKTASFEAIKDIYGKNSFSEIIDWMNDNVVNYEDTRKSAFGCGLPGGNREMPNARTLIKKELDKMVSAYSIGQPDSTPAPVTARGGASLASFTAYANRFFNWIASGIKRRTPAVTSHNQ